MALLADHEGEWQRVGEIVRVPPEFVMLRIGAINLPCPDSNPVEDLQERLDFVELKVYE